MHRAVVFIRIILCCLFAPITPVYGEFDAYEMVDCISQSEIIKPIHLLPITEELDAEEEEISSVIADQAIAEPEEDPEETDNLERLLSLVQDVDIPMPDVKKPSFFTIGLRSYGIAFVYKCFGLKQWFANKFF